MCLEGCLYDKMKSDLDSWSQDIFVSGRLYSFSAVSGEILLGKRHYRFEDRVVLIGRKHCCDMINRPKDSMASWFLALLSKHFMSMMVRIKICGQ